MERMMRIPEVVLVTGLSKTTIWRRVKSGIPRALEAGESRHPLGRLARGRGRELARQQASLRQVGAYR